LEIGSAPKSREWLKMPATRAARKIRRRACIRIGELSRDLETAQGARNELLPSDGKKSKSETLADAGISTSTASRYEELAGGKEQQAQGVAKAGRRI
jgi:hypothetical protein